MRSTDCYVWPDFAVNGWVKLAAFATSQYRQIDRIRSMRFRLRRKCGSAARTAQPHR
jgi:hypothetical protein